MREVEQVKDPEATTRTAGPWNPFADFLPRWLFQTTRGKGGNTAPKRPRFWRMKRSVRVQMAKLSRRANRRAR